MGITQINTNKIKLMKFTSLLALAVGDAAAHGEVYAPVTYSAPVSYTYPATYWDHYPAYDWGYNYYPAASYYDPGYYTAASYYGPGYYTGYYGSYTHSHR